MDYRIKHSLFYYENSGKPCLISDQTATDIIICEDCKKLTSGRCYKHLAEKKLNNNT
ncbi:MAG: hypothetical protein UT43_C0001G0012 [Parcubacteria group bacterium GW2011_GWC1_39_29]|uniref:Uncharacterized protein n=1 Tax=Candidatus Yanofskybacteria bacterium GW2011_GWD1_39_16 TaxID=1619030 RepID=A0A837HSR1_9BACT|nr:MAG: hypothetical protein UT35_C0004G0005 [Candidatus Yanofskybacteria bacterium GW2011_GWD1_39_16]KKR15389.1 MAG: hypothetical protein UT43_C0001G0012 [Parcubacteria group bacterium GW2011_GWC1_39_29]